MQLVCHVCRRGIRVHGALRLQWFGDVRTDNLNVCFGFRYIHHDCSRSLLALEKIHLFVVAAEEIVDSLPEVNVDGTVKDKIDSKVDGLHEVGDDVSCHVDVVAFLGTPDCKVPGQLDEF